MKIAGELIHYRRLDNAAAVNAAILKRFHDIKGSGAVRRTHFCHARFENTYVPLEVIPELRPVAEAGLRWAGEILGRADLRYGFWFNEMPAGSCTGLHAHDDDDEWLSGCYYIRVPDRCGRFLAIEEGRETPVDPEEGLFVFFSPELPHAVEENQSGETRLSVAFNYGPVEET